MGMLPVPRGVGEFENLKSSGVLVSGAPAPGSPEGNPQEHPTGLLQGTCLAAEGSRLEAQGRISSDVGPGASPLKPRALSREALDSAAAVSIQLSAVS